MHSIEGLLILILTAHQPVYIPWLGLFHKIALSDLFISFDQVQYQPKDWNNRNRIKTQQGPIWLSVPVLRKGYLDKTISDIEINNAEPWGRKHWRSIKLSYAKAPYFIKYADFFEDTYNSKWDSLVDLNTYMLKWFIDVLKIGVPVHSAGEWKFEGEKSGLVLDMCKQVKADHYIFGALGKEYADRESFKNANIGIYFQDYHHPIYPQLHGDFVPYLSVIDLIFNCGDESLDIIMSGNIQRNSLL